jgi:hypothetical protein
MDCDRILIPSGLLSNQPHIHSTVTSSPLLSLSRPITLASVPQLIPALEIDHPCHSSVYGVVYCSVVVVILMTSCFKGFRVPARTAILRNAGNARQRGGLPHKKPGQGRRAKSWWVYA